MHFHSSLQLPQARHACFVHIRFIARLARPDPALLFLGQTLRGAFGYALKDIACSTPHRECDRCPLQTSCAFQTVFNGADPFVPSADEDGSGSIPPFVLEVASPGTWWGERDQLAWGITLFGTEIRKFAYVVEAFRHAGRRGLGPAGTRYEILSVRDAVTDRELGTHPDSAFNPPTVVPMTQFSRELRDGPMLWHFHTPVHFTTNGNLLSADDPIRIIRSGRRRFQALGGPSILEEPSLDPSDFRVLDSQLQHWHIERFSTRQKRRIPLEGFHGSVLIEGPWSRAGQWLHAADRIHLGKHSTFGLGRVSWRQN